MITIIRSDKYLRLEGCCGLVIRVMRIYEFYMCIYFNFLERFFVGCVMIVLLLIFNLRNHEKVTFIVFVLFLSCFLLVIIFLGYNHSAVTQSISPSSICPCFSTDCYWNEGHSDCQPFYWEWACSIVCDSLHMANY